MPTLKLTSDKWGQLVTILDQYASDVENDTALRVRARFIYWKIKEVSTESE